MPILSVKNSCKISMLLLLALLEACSPKLQLAETQNQEYPIKADQPQDSSVLAYVQPYKIKLDSMMNRVIGNSTEVIDKGNPKGLLNNFVCDATAEIARKNSIKFDFVIMNTGGLRGDLPKGDIHVGDVFGVMPFENALSTVNYSGVQIQKIADWAASKNGQPVSGIRFIISNDKATEIMIRGKAIDPQKTYTVLTSDYLAGGGDDSPFASGKNRKDYTLKIRDVLIQYIEQQKTLNPESDGRISKQ